MILERLEVVEDGITFWRGKETFVDVVAKIDDWNFGVETLIG
jgi:hypothetical protein